MRVNVFPLLLNSSLKTEALFFLRVFFFFPNLNAQSWANLRGVTSWVALVSVKTFLSKSMNNLKEI